MSPNSAFQTNRVSDALAKDIEIRILEGSLKPGDRLPPERDLATQLGVSRASIREAIQKLATKGLVMTRHGGGTVVTDKMEAPFVDPWQEMLSGHPRLRTDLLEFRQMLESQAAHYAAERATPADMERIAAAYAALETNRADNAIESSVDSDIAFHQAIADASHNALIGHLSASVLRVIHGHISQNIDRLHAQPQRWNTLQEQHRALWHAIRDRNSPAAAQAAHEHIEFVKQTMADSDAEQQRQQSALRRLGERI